MKVQDKGYFLQVLKINRFLNGNEEDIEPLPVLMCMLSNYGLQEFHPNLAASVSFHQFYSILFGWHNRIKWFSLRYGYIRNIV